MNGADDMTLRHLEIFCAVCAQGSFTRAAEKLNMAQPAVSLAIRELEVFYNVRLFERMNRRIYLTEAGRTLRQYADTVLSQMRESVEVLRESGARGTCAFGVHVTLGETRLAEILIHLAAELPEMEIRACVQNSRDYLAEPLCGETLAAVCAPVYLPGKDTLTLAELAGERLLLREQGSGTRSSVEAGFQQAGVPIRPAVESISTAALLSCARAGLGITLLPRSLVERDVARGSLRELTVVGGSFCRNYFLVRHRGKYLTDGMRRVIQVLREHLGDTQT